MFKKFEDRQAQDVAVEDGHSSDAPMGRNLAQNGVELVPPAGHPAGQPFGISPDVLRRRGLRPLRPQDILDGRVVEFGFVENLQGSFARGSAFAHGVLVFRVPAPRSVPRRRLGFKVWRP